MGATTNSGEFTWQIVSVLVRGNGDCVITLQYVNATGKVRATRAFYGRADGGPVTSDDPADGNISATTPAGLNTALGTARTQVSSTISTAAGTGKLDL